MAASTFSTGRFIASSRYGDADLKMAFIPLSSANWADNYPHGALAPVQRFVRHARGGVSVVILANHADDNALDVDALGGFDDRLISWIGRLQPDLVGFAVKPLHGGVVAVD